MKRIKAAFLQQTLKFILSDKLEHEEAVKHSATEADEYLKGLDESRTKYVLLSRSTDEDGATVLEVKRQYGTAPTGDYI